MQLKDELDYWVRVTAHTCELWMDEFGPYMNDVYKSMDLYIPASMSDLAIARFVKRKLGIQGMRKDTWCDDTFCWRDGSVGAYAVVHG